MPFKSNAQRKFMYANLPKIAERWSKHTPKGKKLPEYVKESYESDLDFKSVLSDKKYDYLVTYNLDPQNDIVIGHKNGEAETVFLHRLGDVVHGKSNIVLAQIGPQSTPQTGPYSKNTRSILQYNLPKISKKLKTPEDVESFIQVFVNDSYNRIESHKEDEQHHSPLTTKEKEVGFEESLRFEALCNKILSE